MAKAILFSIHSDQSMERAGQFPLTYLKKVNKWIKKSRSGSVTDRLFYRPRDLPYTLTRFSNKAKASSKKMLSSQ